MAIDIIIKKERADDYIIQTTKMAYAINNCLYETAVVDKSGEILWINHDVSKRKALKSHEEAKKFLKG